jgi:hypothetical protein
MYGAEDRRALGRPPVSNLSWSATRQPWLANRLAHASRIGSLGTGSIGSGIVKWPASGMLAAAAVAEPTAMPNGANVVVIIGILLGVWAIVSRRTVLGLSIILLALTLAGATALTQEVEHSLHSQHTQAVAFQSRAV